MNVLNSFESVIGLHQTGSYEQLESILVFITNLLYEFKVNHVTQNENQSQIISKLNDIMADILLLDNLASIWKNLLVEPNRALFLKRFKIIINANKSISNFLGYNNMQKCYSSSQWNTSITTALILMIKNSISSSNSNHDLPLITDRLSDLFSNMPKALHVKFIETLSKEEKIPVQLLHFFESNIISSWAFDSIIIFLDLYRARSIDINLSKDLFRSLLLNALESSGLDRVVKLLFLKKSNRIEDIPIFLSIFAEQNDLPRVLEILLDTYSDAHFINKGDENIHAYLSGVILIGIGSLDKEVLSSLECGVRSQPLMVSISKAISANLDSSHKMKRLNSMKIAERYASILGHELSFEELKENNNHSSSSSSSSSSSKCTETNDSGGVKVDVKRSTTNKEIAAAAAGSDNRSSSSSSSSSSSDSSSEDEFEDYPEIKEENSDTNRIFYLSLCIEYIRKDSGPEAYKLFRKALESIPEIIKTYPSDGTELGPVLTRELLRASNAFNMEDFDKLKETALLSLISTYPSHTLPVLGKALKDESSAISTKIYSLALLGRAAEMIAGITTQPPSPKSSDYEASNDAFTGLSVYNNSSKTRIIRPRKLKTLQQKTIYYQNTIAHVMPLLFDPVKDLLVTVFSSKSTASTNSPLATMRCTDSQFNSYEKLNSPSDMLDGIDSFIPVQCLHTLEALVRSSFHTNVQHQVYVNTIYLAWEFTSSTSLSLRSAALSAIKASISSWFNMKTRVDSNNQRLLKCGNLEGLMDIFGQYSNVSNAAASIADSDDKLVSNMVEWCITMKGKEPDPNIQNDMVEIVKYAIAAFEVEG